MTRVRYLDLVKAIAILFVVFTHLKENMGYYGLHDYGFITSYYIDRMGVPLFFMASGVLLLGRERFFSIKLSKRLLGIVIGVSIISILTNYIYYHLNYGLTSFFTSIEWNNTITNNNTDKAYQLWYIFYYIPLLILSIPLSSFTSKATQGQLLTLSVVFFVIGPMAQYASLYFVNPYIYVFTKTDIFSYLLYMFIGLYIHRLNSFGKGNVIALLLLLISVFFVSFFRWKLPFIFDKSIWYSSEISLYISSSLLFYICSSYKGERLFSIINFLGVNSYSVYLLHVMIMYAFIYFYSSWLVWLPSKLFLSFLIFASSLLVSYVLNKTPARFLLS